ncbi:DNA cytosine methyltransferase, partial [Rhizobium sp.]|uniref:DNA cytosine methyltransferase n=1 Tax=Rhizobium sp. TaxID=391 RepID=UPI0034C698E9
MPEPTNNMIAARFASAKEAILASRRRQVAGFLQTVDALESLKAEWPDVDDGELVAWLRSNIGMSNAEARTVVGFSQHLGSERKLIGANAVSPEVIAELLKSDEATRIECLEMITKGAILDAPFVARLRRRNALVKLSPDEQDASARRKAFEKAARKAAAALMADLEDRSAALAASLECLRQRSLWDIAPLNDGIRPDVDEQTEEASHGAAPAAGNPWQAYGKDRVDLLARAADVRSSFERFFGCDHAAPSDFMKIFAKNRTKAYISSVWHALADLGRGDFAPADLNPRNGTGRSIAGAIRYLAGLQSSTDFFAPPRRGLVPSSGLTLFDIDAGIGGASLGLETAGFRPVAVYADYANELEVLRLNRRYWNVKSYATAVTMSLYADAGVSLLTGGKILRLPKPGSKGAKLAMNQFFARQLNAISVVRPKAFMFGIDPSIMDRSNAWLRSQIASEARELGFAVHWETVAGLVVGLPQRGHHVVLVGMSPERMSDYPAPVFVSPKKRSLGAAIGDIVGSHRWALPHFPPHQRAFNEWLANWRSGPGLQPAPPFLQGSALPVKDWGDLDVDCTGFSDRPPSPEDVTLAGYKFKLTTRMLARILGFPDGWGVDSAFSSLALSMRESISPVVAKLVGLAIHEALTGRRIDFA